MEMSSPEGAAAYNEFKQEVEALKGDALLAKKARFDQLPPAEAGDEVRLYQGIALEAALTQEFGLGQWQAALQTYEAHNANRT